MKNLTGKIAVITGGNSGIGYATAKELKQNGAQVVITGRRKEAVERAAKELDVIGLVADQSSIMDIEMLMKDVARRFGSIDILLVNAGITKFSLIEQMQESVFDEVMNVNFKGAYFTLSKFIPILKENSSVILLSSTSAHISPPQGSVYAASKAALNAVMKIAAVELALRKIRVNAVSPGPVATEIMDKIGLNSALEESMIASIPMARMGKAVEVAKLIAFLSSDDASFITGSEYFVDGGQSI